MARLWKFGKPISVVEQIVFVPNYFLPIFSPLSIASADTSVFLSFSILSLCRFTRFSCLYWLPVVSHDFFKILFHSSG